MKTHDFTKSNELGKRGEQVIQRFFGKRDTVARYEDVSDQKEYQDKDIDGILHLANGDTLTVELKTDQYISGNIFYETDSCVEWHTPGCMNKTQAKCLCYYFPNFHVMYCIDMEAYRAWFEQNKSRFRYVTFKNYKRNYRGTYHSGGHLIPMTFFESNFDSKYWKKFAMPSLQIA